MAVHVNTVMLRGRQLIRVTRGEGYREVLRRIVARSAKRIGADLPVLPLGVEDVVDSTSLVLPPSLPPKEAGSCLSIAWVCSPPSEGSGGHTTMFRFVQALERHGHQCTLYVYDRFGNDVSVHEQVLRSWWPEVRAEVRDAAAGIPAADAYFATSWASAHILAGRASAPGHRFYLAQDFEPFFYPRGSLYALAEDTYRFGFEHISVGHMVADVLQSNLGLKATVAKFGCDRGVYRVTNERRRSAVIFYAKPDTPRRGFQLAVLGLQQFNHAHPDVAIHVFGADPGRLPFPTVNHRHLRPSQLAELYNSCAAGLAFSFTNISLIAQELLACGVVPIVNDDSYTRADLDNSNVGWTHPAPKAVADALWRAVSGQHEEPVKISASLPEQSWHEAEQTLVAAIHERCYGHQV